MEDIEFLKQLVGYRPMARRRPGQPLKKLQDG